MAFEVHQNSQPERLFVNSGNLGLFALLSGVQRWAAKVSRALVLRRLGGGSVVGGARRTHRTGLGLLVAEEWERGKKKRWKWVGRQQRDRQTD